MCRELLARVMNLTEGIRLEHEGRLAEAAVVCQQVLGLEPKNLKALHLFGTILYRQGEFDRAIEILKRAVALAPKAAEFRINLAASLGKTGRHGEALEHLAAALRLNGNTPELHNNLGLTLTALDRYSEAEKAFSAAIRLAPKYPEARLNLGNVLRKMGRMNAAAEAYREALRLRPDYVKAHDGLANVAVELGDLDTAISCFRRMLEIDPNHAGAFSALLYTLHYHPDYDAADLYREHREWGRRFCDPLIGKIQPHENDRTPDRRLRVGYVSPDFREQTVPRFIGAALAHHDHAQFEIYCYSDVEKPDATTERLKPFADHWRNTIGQSDEALDRLIREDRIDILVDLRGHASRNRMKLFARKPAPVQVNMVGYFNTTGLATMDWRITDAHQDPPRMTEHLHTERLARIPRTCWCFTADDDAPNIVEPPAVANGYITFGSLNKFVKVSEPCARMWASVLEKTPGSRLVLVIKSIEPTQAARKRLIKVGLPPDRVTVLGKVRSRREYLERFNQIDIALDTFPFNGITTTCDGLWMGVPVVSLAGETSVSRAGNSILHGLGMPELVAESPDEFVRIASELTADLPRLQSLRVSMRDRMGRSPLMAHKDFTVALQRVYRSMWVEFAVACQVETHPQNGTD